MQSIPLADLGSLYVFDVAEEDAAHGDILRFLVIVEMVSAVALLLPFVVALVRAGSLSAS